MGVRDLNSSFLRAQSHLLILVCALRSDAMLSVLSSVLLRVRVSPSQSSGVELGQKCCGFRSRDKLSSWSSDRFIYCLC